MSPESGPKTRNYAKRTSDEFNFLRWCFQKFWMYIIAMPFFAIFYRYEIKGRENIPKDRKFICAANHISHFDPLLVSLAVKKPIAYMAKKELFENSKFFCTLIDWLGAFAVNREKLEVSTIKTVKEVFKSSWMLGIFPEGGIYRTRIKTIENLGVGFAVISKAAKCDILPISIVGCEEYNWIPFKSKIVVKIGTPISHELSQDEIINTWGKQVAELCNYTFIPVESEHSEVRDQEDFANA